MSLSQHPHHQTDAPSILLSIEGAPHQATVQQLTNEYGDDTLVLPFEAAYEVLTAWRKGDLDHRSFGWTGIEDAAEPEDAYVAWVDDAGTLRTHHAEVFWDGVAVVNAYEVSTLTAVPGIDLVTPSVEAEEGHLECSRHGGEWGGDETCPNCTDLGGDPLPTPKPLVRAVAEALEERGADLAAQLVRDTDPDDDLWKNYLGPMLDDLEADYTTLAREIEAESVDDIFPTT